MAAGGFELRGWQCSNLKRTDQQTPVLGLIWDIEENTLMLAPTTLLRKPPEKITKKEILSFAQRIFDPLGIACPVEMKPKLLLKKIWSKNIDWDIEVEDDIKKTFLQW